jgi:hypothetical protein
MNVAVLQPRILKWKCTVASEERINCLWKSCALGTQLLFFKTYSLAEHSEKLYFVQHG